MRKALFLTAIDRGTIFLYTRKPEKDSDPATYGNKKQNRGIYFKRDPRITIINVMTNRNPEKGSYKGNAGVPVPNFILMKHRIYNRVGMLAAAIIHFRIK
jgi:hypothetical protein